MKMLTTSCADGDGGLAGYLTRFGSHQPAVPTGSIDLTETETPK
jgi:hypothetical protein